MNKRKVPILIAYHGFYFIFNPYERSQVLQSLTNICKGDSIHCLNLDDYFTKETHSHYFLSDGHWNTIGHRNTGLLLQIFLA